MQRIASEKNVLRLRAPAERNRRRVLKEQDGIRNVTGDAALDMRLLQLEAALITDPAEPLKLSCCRTRRE
jgi:hypothetical protein